MTGTQLAALVHKNTRTNTTTFPLADMLIDVNLYKDDMAAAAVEINASVFLVPATDSLILNQREYAFPDDVLRRIQKVEIKFASADARFPIFAIKDYQGSETESEIVKRFSNAPQVGSGDNLFSGPAYVIRRRALFILSGSIVAVTDAIRIWYNSFPADLANLTGGTGLEVDPTTTTHGIPRTLHELLARQTVIAYKGRQPKPIPLSPLEKRFKTDLDDAINALARDNNALEIIGEMPPPGDMGNHGFDY